MPDTLEAPPTGTAESTALKSAMSGWMAGLQKELPNPQLGQGNQPASPPAEPAAPAEPAEPVAATPAAAPAAAPVTPPAGQVQTEPAAPGEEKWPRSAKEWKNFTTARKAKDQEYEKQITQKDQKIKELEAQASAQGLPPEIKAQLETLKKENDEYSKQLRLVAVTQHPKFKNYFDSKTNGTLSQLKSCVPADQLDHVTRLVQMPDSDAKEEEINTMMDSMTTLQRGRFLGVINSLSSIQTERESEVSRAQQDYEQMMTQQKTEREGRVAQFTKLLDDTVKGMQDAKAGRPEYQLRDGETEWNASVQKRIDVGKTLIAGKLTPEIMFKAAFDAAAYPDVLAGYKAVLGENEKLKKQIASMTAANPRIESPKRTEVNGNSPATPAMPKESRPMDYTHNWVKKFGEAMRGDSA